MNFQLLITGTMPLNHKLMWRTGLAFPFSMPQEMFGDFWARTWLWWVQSFGCRCKRERQGPTLLWLFFPLLPCRLGAFRSSKCLLRPPLCRPCPLSLPSSTESWGWATQTWQSTASRQCLTASCLSMFSKKKCSRFITAGGLSDRDGGCYRKETPWNLITASLVRTVSHILLEHLASICFFLDEESLSERFWAFSQIFRCLCLVSSSGNDSVLINLPQCWKIRTEDFSDEWPD